MAVSGVSFQSQIDSWVKETNLRMRAVFRESTQRVISEAQAHIPVDTGFARASLRVSLDEMPQIDASAHGAKGTGYPWDPGEMTAVISNAEIGGTIYAGWTAAYVIPLEYGHSKQAPSGFVRLAAMQWPQIVSQVTVEAKARIAGA